MSDILGKMLIRVIGAVLKDYTQATQKVVDGHPDMKKAYKTAQYAQGAISFYMHVANECYKEGEDVFKYATPKQKAIMQLWFLCENSNIETHLLDDFNPEQAINEVLDKEDMDDAKKKETIKEAQKALDDRRLRRLLDGGAKGNASRQALHETLRHFRDASKRDQLDPEQQKKLENICEDATEVVANILTNVLGLDNLKVDRTKPCPICMKESGSMEHILSHDPVEVIEYFESSEKGN